MKEGLIFVQKAYYLSFLHLARSRTPKLFTSTCMRAYARFCVCYNKDESMRERESEKEKEREMGWGLCSIDFR